MRRLPYLRAVGHRPRGGVERRRVRDRTNAAESRRKLQPSGQTAQNDPPPGVASRADSRSIEA